MRQDDEAGPLQWALWLTREEQMWRRVKGRPMFTPHSAVCKANRRAPRRRARAA